MFNQPNYLIINDNIIDLEVELNLYLTKSERLRGIMIIGIGQKFLMIFHRLRNWNYVDLIRVFLTSCFIGKSSMHT